MVDCKLNHEEQLVMDDILKAFDGIKGLGLKANVVELCHAVHTLQTFVVQHMCARLNPVDWGDWFNMHDST